MLWCTQGCIHLFKFVFCIPLDKYPGVKMLDHMVVLLLIFLRILRTIVPNGYINLCSHQQCTRVLLSPHPRQHLLSFVFMITATLTGVRWYLIMVLSCTFPMVNDVVHLFIYLLPISMFSLEKYLDSLPF